MDAHYTIIGITIVGIVIFQIRSFLLNDKNAKKFKSIFPRLTDDTYRIEIEFSEINKHVNSIHTDYKNNILNVILDTLNSYLEKNSSTANDFHLMKDIVERNCSIKEEEIDTRNSMPLYLGLMGTMAGILIGVGFLVFNGGLDLLLDTSQADSAEAAKGLKELLGGVAIAMISGIVGIALTTINFAKLNKAKALVEKNKNDFYSWIQAQLLPSLNLDTANSLHKLSQNLVTFNNSFSENTKELGDTLSKINTSYKNQEELIRTIGELNINDIASANIRVLEEFRKSADQIGEFNQYLHAVTGYISKIDILTERIDAQLTRTKAIEDMGVFFKEEIQQVDRKSVV